MKPLLILLALCSTAFAQFGLRSPGFVAGTMVPPVSGGSSLLTGLQAYWTMDETSGNRADSLGVYTLTDASTVPYDAGKIGNAGSFSIQNLEYMTLAANPFNFASAGTINMWLYMTNIAIVGGASGSQTFMAFVVDTDNGFRFGNDESGGGGRLFCSFRQGGTAYGKVSNSQMITNATWVMVSVVWSGSAIVLYVNGAAPSLADNTFSQSVGYTVGSKITTTGNFGGRLDEIGIWSRALSSSDLVSLFNSGTGRTYPFTGAP